uniref:Homeobox domain-containing protein n=1 Tax=Fagus sylvatica TaxID=28930 RepID=A0A2N9H014_FAGSY
MELRLSLGDDSKPFGFLEKPCDQVGKEDLGFCMGLSIGTNIPREKEVEEKQREDVAAPDQEEDEENDQSKGIYPNPPLQLDLLPHIPVCRTNPPPYHASVPWPPENGSSEVGSSRGFNVNRLMEVAAASEKEEEAEDAAAVSSSPHSASSSFQMEFCIYSRGNGGRNNKRESEGEAERASSRASDEDDNGGTRKKLRLSKEQSAFLEESFKEHSTLNPKQKLALAKQLNLRPRQVEVWFQNRRARTKLKQTEVDCDYLKRCCETLTEENRRLHKELQELRALKTSNPFYMQLPATTLTMCPSCERVATTSSPASLALTTTSNTMTTDPTSKANGFNFTRSRYYPFSPTQTHSHQSNT